MGEAAEDVLYQQFETQLALKAHVAALSVAAQLKRRFPSDERGVVAEARVAAATGDLEGAAALLDALQPERRGLPHALAHLADVSLKRGDHVRAHALSLQCIRLGLHAPVAWRVHGMTLAQRGDAKDAVTWLGRCLAVQPGDVVAWKALAQACRTGGQQRSAVQALTHLLTLDRKGLDTWLLLVRTLAELGDAEEARNRVQEALGVFPRNTELLSLASQIRTLATTTNNAVREALELVRGHLDAGDRTRAKALLDQLALTNRPTRAMKFARAELEAAEPGTEVAHHIMGVNKMMKEYPDAWEPRALAAELLLRKGRMRNIPQAGTHAGEAWTLSGGSPRVGLLLIRIWMAEGKPGLAEAMARQVRALGPVMASRVDQALASSKKNA